MAGSSSTAAPPAPRAPTSRPTAPASTTTTSPRAPASRPGTSPRLPGERGYAAVAAVQEVVTRGRWTGTPTSGGSPGTTSRPASPKGRLRTDERALRFVEVVVNGPKTWSLAATLHPEIAAAYDAAQDEAAVEIIGWLADHATTRVGPRGRQVQVPGRAARGRGRAALHLPRRRPAPPPPPADQRPRLRRRRWRGLHSVGVVDSIEAINGIGHAAVMCDPGVPPGARRPRLHPRPRHRRGQPSSRRTPERSAPAPHRSPATSTATKPSGAASTPDQEPGPTLRRTWDRRAWSAARPDKVVPEDGTELRRRWVEELHDLGFTPPATADVRAPSKLGTAIGRVEPGRRRRPRAVPAGCTAIELERRRHPRRGRAHRRLGRHRRPGRGTPRARRGPHRSSRRTVRAAARTATTSPTTSAPSPPDRCSTSKPTSSPVSPPAPANAGTSASGRPRRRRTRPRPRPARSRRRTHRRPPACW